VSVVIRQSTNGAASRAAAIPDAVREVWQRVDAQGRLNQLIGEQRVLREAIARYE
jgi:hypothetical protein